MSDKKPNAEVLQAKQIRIGYQTPEGGPKVILDGLDFSLNVGEMVVVLGQSGVGKSSLLRIFAGLDSALSGDVSLFGEGIKPPHPGIGFLFQQPILLPWLNVRQNVAFGMKFKARKSVDGGLLDKKTLNKRVHTALAEVGLPQAANLAASQLSGGMAQRVALARLLVHHPKIMLLDEPFSALDALNRQEMQTLLCDINKHHQTAMVMVSHDIDEALCIADRIIVLGDMPAYVLGEWQLTTPKPRLEHLNELSDIRQQIVSALHHSKAQTEQYEPEWMI